MNGELVDTSCVKLEPGLDSVKQEPGLDNVNQAYKTNKKQILVNFGLGRKKIFQVDDKNTLVSQFSSYVDYDPAFSDLLKDCFLIFQVFNSKFATWVDIDEEENLSDGTVVRAVFFPKKIDLDDKRPGALKRKRFDCANVIEPDCSNVKYEDVEVCEIPCDELTYEAVNYPGISDSFLQNYQNERVSRASGRVDNFQQSSAAVPLEKKQPEERVGNLIDNVVRDTGNTSAFSDTSCLSPSIPSSPFSLTKTQHVPLTPVTHSSCSNIKYLTPAPESPHITRENAADSIWHSPVPNTTFSNTRIHTPSCPFLPPRIPEESVVNSTPQVSVTNSSDSEVECLSPLRSTYLRSLFLPTPLLPRVQQECNALGIKQTMRKGMNRQETYVDHKKQEVEQQNLRATSRVSSVPRRVEKDSGRTLTQLKTVTAVADTTILSESHHASTSRNRSVDGGLHNYRPIVVSVVDQMTSNYTSRNSDAGLHALSSVRKIINFVEWHNKYRVNISVKGRSQRMQWGRAVLNRKAWQRYLFSGVSSFVLKSNRIKRLPINPSNEVSQSDVEMFWGCVSYRGPEILSPIGNSFKSEILSALLRNHVLPFVKKLYPNVTVKLQYCRCFSSQYKRPVTSDILKSFMELDQWPNCVSDLNPMEHVWDLLAEKVRNVNCSDNAQMVSVLSSVWVEDPDLKLMCKRYVLSMQSIIDDMIKHGGKSTVMTINWD